LSTGRIWYKFLCISIWCFIFIFSQDSLIGWAEDTIILWIVIVFFFCSSFIFTLFLLNRVVLGSNLMVCFSWVYIGFLRRRGNNLTLGWWLMSWPSFGSPKIVLQKNTFFLLKNVKKPEIKNPRIFLGNGEISLWATTGQKARRIVTMRYFDKTNWRKT
jgi:hypothetical protein